VTGTGTQTGHEQNRYADKEKKQEHRYGQGHGQRNYHRQRHRHWPETLIIIGIGKKLKYSMEVPSGYLTDFPLVNVPCNSSFTGTYGLYLAHSNSVSSEVLLPPGMAQYRGLASEGRAAELQTMCESYSIFRNNNKEGNNRKV
jgi:hypothetical protein